MHHSYHTKFGVAVLIWLMVSMSEYKFTSYVRWIEIVLSTFWNWFFLRTFGCEKRRFFHNKINWTCLIKTKTVIFSLVKNERVLRNNHFSMKFFSLQKSKQPNRKCENMKIWITACEIGWKFYVVIRRIVAMSIIIIFAFVRISEKVKITASFFSRFVTFFSFGLLPTNSIWLIPKFHNVK